MCLVSDMRSVLNGVTVGSLVQLTATAQRNKG